MFFYVIETKTTMHYISIFITILLFNWLIIWHESIISLYSYPLRIEKTSDPYSYSSNIRSEFVFVNIRIRIRIRFKNMETDMGRALSDPHPIRFHP
jgi:hypothetical protein